MDIFSLLNRESEKREKDKVDVMEKERSHRNKPNRSRVNWRLAFIIYAGIIIKVQPWRAFSLFKQLDLIYRAYMDFPGHAWLLYNEVIHIHAPIHPAMWWDEQNPQLWLQQSLPFGCVMTVDTLYSEPASQPFPALWQGTQFNPDCFVGSSLLRVSASGSHAGFTSLYRIP